MNAQDTNINLTLSYDNKEEKKGLLKLQHNNGNVALSFFPEVGGDPTKPNQKARTAQISDFVFQLIEFTMIERDQINPLTDFLKGPQHILKMIFAKENDQIQFYEYILQKVKLTHSDCNPLIYLLETLDQNAKSDSPVYATSLPRNKVGQNVMFNRISIDKINIITQKFGPVSPPETLDSLPDNENFPMSLFNKNLNHHVASQAISQLLFNDIRDSSDSEKEEYFKKKLISYTSLKAQWAKMSKEQYDNFVDFQHLVFLLETDILANTNLFQNFSSPKEIQKIAFNVLLTLSFWCWDKASYVKGFIRFLMPFLLCFISNSDGQQVTMSSGDKVSLDEAESKVFWTFWAFFDKHNLQEYIRPIKKLQMKTLFTDIGKTLENKYLDLLKLLLQKHVFCLDFLAEDINSFFTTCFSGDILLRLFISMLAFEEKYPNGAFFQSFVIAMLLSLSPHFIRMNPLSSSEFFEIYKNIRKDLNLDELLTFVHRSQQLEENE